MKTKFWVTLSVPVEVEDEQNGIPLAQSALDTGWELLIDPDGPPEGLVEHVAVGDERPAILATNLLPEGHSEPLLADLSNIETATEVDFPTDGAVAL